MILANARVRLAAADYDLVVSALARGDPAARARWADRMAAEGPDPLLDDPDLLDRLRAGRSLAVPSAALFTYVAVRHTLRVAGIDDRALADYLAALILEFSDHDRSSRAAGVDDQTYRYLIDIVSDLADENGTGDRAFLLRVHLGNYSLWLAGLFPDYIAARRRRAGGPDLPYYDELGRRGFALAADHALADRYGMTGIYRAAAERFPAVRVAINRLSDRVFFPDVFTPERVLRSL